MIKIKLVDMPFAALERPSLALAQIKATIFSTLGDDTEVEICQLNHDFYSFINDINVYQHALSVEGLNSGYGDWIFRHIAFPEATDNIDDYLARYYFSDTASSQLIKDFTIKKRMQLAEFLTSLMHKYELHEADIIGFTSFFSQNVACMAMARLIKDQNPDAITVMGGPTCEMGMGLEIIKNVPQIDFVFSGPGLISFPEFISHYINDQRDKCHSIDGVFSTKNYASCLAAGNTITHSNRIDINNKPIKLLGKELNIDVEINVDYEPFFDSLEKNLKSLNLEPTLMFETSRGCWWGERAHCTFCGLNSESMNYRAMQTQRAISEINRVLEYYPRCKHFDCVDNIAPKNYFSDVFPYIHPPNDCTIFYEVRSNLTNEDLNTLWNSRIVKIQPGIESLATSTLKLMKKGTTSINNVMFLKNCMLNGITPLWNILLGFPGEDELTLEKYIHDIPILSHLQPPTGVFPVRFDRYSPYFENTKDYDLNLKPYDFYSLTYPFKDIESITNMAYYFLDYNGSATYMINLAKWYGKIKKLVDLWTDMWEKKNSSNLPALYMTNNNGSYTIYDSRSGTLKNYTINHIAAMSLELLNEPMSKQGLYNQFENTSKSDIYENIEYLTNKKLVYIERDKIISLVFPYNPHVNTNYETPKVVHTA